MGDKYFLIDVKGPPKFEGLIKLNINVSKFPSYPTTQISKNGHTEKNQINNLQN